MLRHLFDLLALLDDHFLVNFEDFEELDFQDHLVEVVAEQLQPIDCPPVVRDFVVLLHVLFFFISFGVQFMQLFQQNLLFHGDGARLLHVLFHVLDEARALQHAVQHVLVVEDAGKPVVDLLLALIVHVLVARLVVLQLFQLLGQRRFLSDQTFVTLSEPIKHGSHHFDLFPVVHDLEVFFLERLKNVVDALGLL